MKRLAILAALGLAAAGVVPALAQSAASLAEARAKGEVGERFDGYLGYAVRPSSAAVRAQAESVNIRRRALYTDLATRRSVTVQEVGITAGCSLLGRVQAGESYLLQDGTWRRRGAGEGAPVPDYCRAR